MKIKKNLTSGVVEFIKKRKRFSLKNLVATTGFERKQIIRILSKLCNEGYIEPIQKNNISNLKEVKSPVNNSVFRCLKDLSLRKSIRPENSRDKIWKTLRYIKKATRSDIVRLTGCAPSTVEDYTRLLSKHNYIKKIGMQGREKVWFLVQDIGPRKPAIRKETKVV